MANDSAASPVLKLSKLFTMPLEPQHIEQLQQQGKLVKVERSDLLPGASGDALFSAQDQNGAPLPVYVVAGLEHDGSTKPAARKVDMPDGTSAIVINEGHHQWNEAYVRSHILQGDAEITRFGKPIAQVRAQIEGNNLLTDREQRLEGLRELEDFTRALAKEKGVDPVEIRIVPPFAGYNAGAAISLEGTRYIAINSYDLAETFGSKERRDELKAIIGHEVSHLANGDLSARGYADIHNTGAQRLIELRADLGTTDPQTLAQYRKAMLMGMIEQYNKDHPDAMITGTTAADLRKVAADDHRKDPTHPDLFERMSVSEAQSALQVGRASLRARTGQDTPQQRQQDEKWIMDVLTTQYMEGTLPEPASLRAAPSPAANLPESVKKQVGDMGKLPMSEADKALKPVTPSSPVQEVPAQERR